MPTASGFNTTTEQRTLWSKYRCAPDKFVKVAFPTTLEPARWPDGIPLPVVPESTGAWFVFVDLMDAYKVTFDEIAGGTYNCRQITEGGGYSLHSYGIALDINPSRNPYGDNLVTDLPGGFVGEVLALRTRNGRRVFRWGGDWDDDPDTGHNKYDAMHFEITCGPADLATGIALPEQETDMPLLPMKLGDGGTTNPDKRSDVAWMQRRLNRTLGAEDQILTDGVYGEATRAAMLKVFNLPGTGTSDQRGEVMTGNLWGRLDEMGAGNGIPGPKGDKGDPGESVVGPRGPQGPPGPAPTGVQFSYD